MNFIFKEKKIDDQARVGILCVGILLMFDF